MEQLKIEHGAWKGTLTGTTAICAMMILLFGSLSLFLIDRGNVQAEARIIQHETNAGEFRDSMNSKQDRVIQATESNTAAIMALIYVISLPQEKRERLNLAEPPQLRQMIRRKADE